MVLTHMVLSGGGMAGLAYIGILRYLRDHGHDRTISHVAGTSIGAFVACAMAMGMTADELTASCETFLAKKENVTFAVESLFELFQDYGMDDGARNILILREHMLRAFGVPDMTFADLLAKTGRTLYVCATDLETLTVTVFSPQHTPNVDVLMAVKASMAMPYLVKPVRVKERLYIDGAVTCNTPWQLFEDVPKEQQLMVAIPVSHRHLTPEVHSLLHYSVKVMYAMWKNIQDNNVPALYPNKVLLDGDTLIHVMPLEFHPDGGIRLHIPIADLYRTAQAGYDAAAAALGSRQTP